MRRIARRDTHQYDHSRSRRSPFPRVGTHGRDRSRTPVPCFHDTLRGAVGGSGRAYRDFARLQPERRRAPRHHVSSLGRWMAGGAAIRHPARERRRGSRERVLVPGSRYHPSGPHHLRAPSDRDDSSPYDGRRCRSGLRSTGPGRRHTRISYDVAGAARQRQDCRRFLCGGAGRHVRFSRTDARRARVRPPAAHIERNDRIAARATT